MAYKGGFLLQPVKTDYGSIGRLYMQGMNAVAQIREGVLKERREMSEQLQKASSFQATGIQDYDMILNRGAQLIRDRFTNAVAMNDAGLISRNDLNLIKTRGVGEATTLANQSKLFAETREQILKDNNAGGLSLAQHDANWFSSPEYVGKVYDPQIQKFRPARNVFDVVEIDGRLFNQITYEEQGLNEKGERVIIENSTLKKLEDTFAPNADRWDKVDVDKTVRAFKGTIGTRDFTYYDENGQLRSIPFSEMQQLGSKIAYSQIQDPAQFANLIENTLDSYGEEFYEELAYSMFNVRGSLHSGGASSLTNEQIEGRFNNRFLKKPEFEDGKLVGFGEKIILEKDSNGNYDDPSKFITNSDRTIDLKDSTRELMKGFMREKLYASLNIDTKTTFDQLKEQEEQQAIRNVIKPMLEYIGGEPRVPTLKDIQNRSAIQNGIAKVNVNQNTIEDAIFNQNTYGNVPNEMINPLLAQLPNNISRVFNNAESVSGVQTPNILDIDKSNLFKNQTDFTGNKMDAINGFIIINIKDGGNPAIMLTGKSLGTEQERKYQSGDIKKKDDPSSIDYELSIKQRQSLGTVYSNPLEPAQIESLFKTLYQGNSEFRDWCDARSNRYSKDTIHTLEALQQFTLQQNAEAVKELNQSTQ